MALYPKNDAEWIAMQNFLANERKGISPRPLEHTNVFDDYFHKPIPEWMEKSDTSARNCRQWYPMNHPMTCGNNRSDEAHKAYQERFGGDFGQLIAVKDGEIRWRCPVCDYEQK